MSLDIIKNKVKCGQFEEARKLIEAESTSRLMSESRQSLDFPLLVMLSLIKNEDAAINLSRLLLEKGYSLNLSDRNGLCALNYAIGDFLLFCVLSILTKSSTRLKHTSKH